MTRKVSPSPDGNRDQISIDFAAGSVGYRFRRGTFRDHALVKAVGASTSKALSVIDATAGLGRDSFLLASLGCRVTLIERSAEIHALLRDGLEKARTEGPEMAEVISRMVLIAGDARDLLPQLRAEVVLVDPMHPPRKGSALTKKDMRVVRTLVGDDSDAAELMQAALAAATKRVVLKWPRRADPLEGIGKPSHQILGRTTRYDVFLARAAPLA